MYKQTIFWGVLTVLLIVMSCGTLELKCDPVVVVTDHDYTSDPSSVPYKEVHDEFAENYSGEDLSIELRGEIIKRMHNKAEAIGEDGGILYRCIKATYSDWDLRPYRIPCYAEKCIYENESIWAIAFNRANSFDEPSLEHFDLFLVSDSTYEIVYHTLSY